MSSTKLFSEIFEEFQKATNKNGRIEVLRKYDHPRFRDFLTISLNPQFQFDVEIPNYRPAPEPAGLNYTYLDLEMPKMYRFIKGHPRRTTDISEKKKTQLMAVILESLHKDEADLMVRCLKKDLGIPFLTAKLVKEAFPDINL